jgi:hypothetical protein
MTLVAAVAGVEIYRGTMPCEDKKSLKMGKTTHFQTLVFKNIRLKNSNTCGVKIFITNTNVFQQ